MGIVDICVVGIYVSLALVLAAFALDEKALEEWRKKGRR